MDNLLTTNELAERLKCSGRNVRLMEADGRLPASLPLGPRVKRWSEQAIQRWIDAGCPRQNVTADA